MKKWTLRMSVLAAAAACFAGCATSGCKCAGDSVCACGAKAACVCAPRVKHVVFVAFDGMGGAYFKENLKIPNMRRMMAEGAWTLHNRSMLPSSSAANWASIYMAAGSEQHGYINWNTTNSVFKPLYTLPSGKFPDVYALCRAAEPAAKLGYVYEWGGMAHVIDLSVCDFTLRTNQCADAGIDFMKKNKPRLMSFVYDYPDAQGHRFGYGTPEYQTAVERADAEIGKVLKALDEAGMTDESVVIVSSDHGGVNKGHGGATELEMDKPLIIWGKGVKSGHEIKSATFSYDIGATMAYLLGLKLPQICTGRPVCEAFR
ncbi:MAG: alkaline phosphatase [Kiritimatiellae bacterium]|nr:alkaline phosphatase [Kiritimatiellia bacterium]